MLTSSSKHAIRAIASLAVRDDADYLSVEELAGESGVPSAYLSKVIKQLATHGVVETKKGVGGGVRMKKRSVSFYEICEVFQDPILIEKCILSSDHCGVNGHCEFHDAWFKERGRIHRFLQQRKIRKRH